MTFDAHHLVDWKRILFGDAPAKFLVEVLFRTLLVYGALLVALRFFGKRMTGQLTNLELGIMITLGAIVSVPMQVPTQGILLALVLLVCALGLQRGLSRLGFENKKIEVLTQGDLSPLVKDGVVLTDQLRHAALSHQQLYAALREQNVRQLGEVRRVYLEGCGEFSVFRAKRPRPGLCIFPEKDAEMVSQCAAVDGHVACSSCGAVVEERARPAKCPSCGGEAWVAAVT